MAEVTAPSQYYRKAAQYGVPADSNVLIEFDGEQGWLCDPDTKERQRELELYWYPPQEIQNYIQRGLWELVP